MELPSPKDLKSKLPLSRHQRDFVDSSRRTIENLVTGEDRRLAIVAGPCSIHEMESALEYAKRFKGLLERVKKTCFLAMRVYFEKPRTITGWKGLLYDPHLDGSHDIQTGLYWTRELLLKMAEWQIPVAAEFLDPLAAAYFDDLVSWGFIGARTSASQTHRQLASSLLMPVGFKNGTDGNIDNAIHGVVAAGSPHSFLGMNEEGRLSIRKSSGNLYTHVVLRGGEAPNFDLGSIHYTLGKLRSQNLPERILIDCAHANCQKQYEKQTNVFYTLMEQVQQGSRHLMGVMLESHLEAGNQLLSEDPSSLRYAVSITDPCIDWSTTEELVLFSDSILSSPLLAVR
jgi:3-deoxy-7-phosphoheptulonate synthase